jgi:NitT/TauT family transport system ATP-binding protein/nitrate/nitrite transport system substrate-binding protein
VLLADHEQIFAGHGVQVITSFEPSWANIADKLGYGLLEGAVMLPPLALACALGLRGPKTGMVVPMSLSANGNTITFANAWAEAFRDGARGLAAALAGQPRKPRLAVVHAFSTHDLLLRYWLGALGIDPDRDVEITVLPPAEVVNAMAAGSIDGFCAGAPWGQVAAHAGIGFVAVNSADIWHDHPEKCLALRADFAAQEPGLVSALLAGPDTLDLPAPLIEAALDPAAGGPVFSQNYPLASHGAWFAGQLIRWGKAPPAALHAVAALYRPDLFVAAGGAVPDMKCEIFMQDGGVLP